MPSCARSSRPASPRSTPCPASRAIICSTPCSTPAMRWRWCVPGFLNSTAALATAYSTGARVLALIGQIPSRGIGKGHGLLHEIPDQIGILRTLTKWAERVTNPQAAPALVGRAFQLLQSGRPRPVGIELPPDVLAAKAEVNLMVQFAAEPE